MPSVDILTWTKSSLNGLGRQEPGAPKRLPKSPIIAYPLSNRVWRLPDWDRVWNPSVTRRSSFAAPVRGTPARRWETKRSGEKETEWLWERRRAKGEERTAHEVNVEPETRRHSRRCSPRDKQKILTLYPVASLDKSGIRRLSRDGGLLRASNSERAFTQPTKLNQLLEYQFTVGQIAKTPTRFLAQKRLRQPASSAPREGSDQQDPNAETDASNPLSGSASRPFPLKPQPR